LLFQANRILNETRTSNAGGTDVATTELWTDAPTRAALQAAVSSAQDNLNSWFIAKPRQIDDFRHTNSHAPNFQRTYPPDLPWPPVQEGAYQMLDDFFPVEGYAPGEQFDLTLQIRNNTGFNSMILRLELPMELELVRMENNISGALISGFFVGPIVWDEVTGNLNPPIRGDRVFAGWANDVGSVSNYSASTANLITFTLRVRTDIGIIDGLSSRPVTFAFRNAHFCEEPTRSNGTTAGLPLNMSFYPGVAVNCGGYNDCGLAGCNNNTWEIGRVLLRNW
jgi:hypothetical protein